MLMTTVLIFYFLRYIKKLPFWLVGAILTVFLIVETSFFCGQCGQAAEAAVLFGF